MVKTLKTEKMIFRLTTSEREAFDIAASLSGISLSSWVRERLRHAAIRDIESAGQKVPFIKPIPVGDPDG